MCWRGGYRLVGRLFHRTRSWRGVRTRFGGRGWGPIRCCLNWKFTVISIYDSHSGTSKNNLETSPTIFHKSHSKHSQTSHSGSSRLYCYGCLWTSSITPSQTISLSCSVPEFLSHSPVSSSRIQNHWNSLKNGCLPLAFPILNFGRLRSWSASQLSKNWWRKFWFIHYLQEFFEVLLWSWASRLLYFFK